jgi:hypothetical protein
MTPDYASLLEGVKAATGPDRELDDAILSAVGWFDADAPARFGAQTIDGRITASLDAALGLVERVLPGCEMSILRTAALRQTRGSEWGADLWDGSLPDGDNAGRYGGKMNSVSGAGPTPALAVLAALLKALSEKDQANG